MIMLSCLSTFTFNSSFVISFKIMYEDVIN
nr:MAG TPA: hypothetical protein [Caudoviricetes sp.]